jgi:phosphohistidine phosphatase
LRLFLLRHAKSDWGNKDLEDFDRPLSARGIDAAPLIGRYMREKGYVPGLIKCSSAQRTRETLDFILPFFERRPKILYSQTLYLAEPKALLEEIRQTPNTIEDLLVVGHNPGMGALAIALTALPEDEAEERRKEQLADKFPTGCLAVLNFSGTSWQNVKPLSGRLVDYVRPRALTAKGDGA